MTKPDSETFFDHTLESKKASGDRPLHVLIRDEEFQQFYSNLKAVFSTIRVQQAVMYFKKFSGADRLQETTNHILDILKKYTAEGDAEVISQKLATKVKNEKMDDDFTLSKTEVIKVKKEQFDDDFYMTPSVTADYTSAAIREPVVKQKKPPPKKPTYQYVSRKRTSDAATGTDYYSPSDYDCYSQVQSQQVRSYTIPTRSVRRRVVMSQFEPKITPKIEDTGKKYWKKFIGTITLRCWCTRSIYGLTSILENNRLIFTKQFGSDMIYVSHQSDPSKQRREMGRITEHLADFIGVLMDEQAVLFESKFLDQAGGRLSTGDTFYIQTDCYLSERVFESEHVKDDSNEDLEVEQLKIMRGPAGNVRAGTRLKGAMIKLFDQIGVKPKEKETPRTLVDLTKPLDNYDDDSQFEELRQNAQIEEVIDAEDLVDENGNPTTDESKLSMNQVKDLYKSTEVNILQQNIPESYPHNFKLDLRPYQRQGLSWMLQREKEYDMIGINNPELDETEKSKVVQQLKDFENSLNPLWKEYKWPRTPDRIVNRDPPVCDKSFYLNLYRGTGSLVKPLIRSTCKGGILADEMGLGKTITTLSLVMSFPKDVHYEALPADDVNRVDDYAYQTTLIIVPMALLSQWEREFQKVSGDNEKFRCVTFYGTDSLGNMKEMMCGPNPPTVVLTTYGMIQSEWSRLSRTNNTSASTGLFSMKFLRVILDEGHNIRNKITKTARSIYELRADRKWILTGTPIINRLDDLFSLVHFLGMRPWCYHSLWKHCISDPFETGKDVTFAVELLKSILDPILLRRTKNQKDKNGNMLVVLPPKVVIIEKLSFNKRELAIYEWLKEKAVNSFNENFKSGMVFKNYSTILIQLLRLRQVCCHVDLIKTGDQEGADDIESNSTENETTKQQKLSTKVDDEMLTLVQNIEAKDQQQRLPIEKVKKLKEEIYEQYPDFKATDCSICTGPINIDTAIITECKHCFCMECLTEHFDFQLKHNNGEPISENADSSDLFKPEEVFCPMCRTQINRNRLFRTVKKNNFTPGAMADVDANETFMTQKPTSIQSTEQSREYFVRPFVPNEQSSKINALLIHLEQIRQEAPGEHVIVFSQFTSFLDIIGTELEKYTGEFEVLRFDGRLNLEQRQRVLDKFEKPIPQGEQKISILLLSLKAGGVGLNLTVASRAFLMDPHWNNAIEFQAIDRIHRMGQMKNVKVIRFIMENSIEERMLEIQERKNQLGEALTISDEERRKRKLEELQSLFKE